MNIREVFSIGDKVINQMERLLEDKEFHQQIEQAGGILSLIGIGIQICEKIRNESKTSKERAFASLLSFVLGTTQGLLKEEMKFDIDFKKKREILNQILRSFDEDHDWNSYLPHHPAVKKFLSIIISYAVEQNYTQYAVNEFVRKFNILIEEKAKEDTDFKSFYNWWTIDNRHRKLVEYLALLENQKYYSSKLNGSDYLSKYYVWNRAAVVDIKSWNQSESQISISGLDIRRIDKIIDDFLKQDKTWYILIAASFGMGKTSTMRMVAALYAGRYLDVPIDAIDKTDGYIPVLVFLKDKLRNVYNQDSLEDIFKTIVAPSQQANNRPILLLLDGLDEYDEDIRKLMDDQIRMLHSNYPNLKVVISTRPLSGILNALGINGETHVRLLPFSKEDVNQFFRNHGVELTYDSVIAAGISEEEITKPLFTWMLSQMQSDFIPSLDQNWTPQIRRSAIYLQFILSLYRGKHKSSMTNDEWKLSYLDEKRALRKIAFLSQIYGEALTLEKMKEYDESGQILNTTSLEPIAGTYLLAISTTGGKKLEFIHKSFKEYLLAEYYLECIIKDRIHGLNIGLPSCETVDFLSGLIGLTAVNGNVIADKLISSGEECLLRTFGEHFDRDTMIATITDNLSRAMKSNSMILFNINYTRVEKLWNIVDSDKQYPNLFIHKWLALLLLKKLKPSLLDKNIIEKILFYSSHFMPNCLKDLSHLDLSNIQVPNVDLAQGNLSGINLSKARLGGANLDGADLNQSDLSGANIIHGTFSDCYIENVKLEKAFLAYSFFLESSLQSCDLSGADLAGSTFFNTTAEHCDFSQANMEGAHWGRAEGGVRAHLSGSNFSDAFLYHADLSGADLSETNLSRAFLDNADISGAYLCRSILVGCKDFHFLNCTQAHFAGSIIDNKELVQYLRENDAVNVPDAITDKEELRKKLKERNLSTEQIEKIIQRSG